jgi:hypothetical protein
VRIWNNTSSNIDPETTLSEDNFFLLQDLPDPQQELAVQNLLEEFHYFPKLPMELRLIIWRCTFPRPRDIRLPYWSYNADGSINLRPISFNPIFPPLSQSSIGRVETRQTHTTCLFWVSLKNTSGVPRSKTPLCFAPKRDTFVLACYILTESFESNFLGPRWEGFEGVFARVKSLKMVESYFCDYMRHLSCGTTISYVSSEPWTN